MKPLHRLATCMLLLPFLFRSFAWAIALDVADSASIKSAAATVAQGLTALYNGNQAGGVLGKYPYPPYYWWQSGAAWGAMVNYWHYTGDDTYNNLTLEAMVSQISDTNDFMPPAEIFNLGNDDQAFWTFGAMSAVEYGFPDPPAPYPTWLTICQNVFNDFVARWQNSSSTCGGGLKWQIYEQNNGYTYKNTISNGGFFQLAARLARITGNQTYADWAGTVWDWTTAIGLINADYRAYDGTDELKNCSDVNHLQWTYNVGVYLYGAAVLQNFTNGDEIWVTRTRGLLSAAKIFTSPYPNATDVLFEAQCEQNQVCNNDQLSMKGYLARWLAGTSLMAPFTAGEIGPILRASGAAAATACTGGAGGTTCGFKWYTGGWDGTTGLGQQMVALEAMYSLLVNETVAPKEAGQNAVIVPAVSAAAQLSTAATTPIPTTDSTPVSTETPAQTRTWTMVTVTTSAAPAPTSTTPPANLTVPDATSNSDSSWSVAALIEFLLHFTAERDSGGSEA